MNDNTPVLMDQQPGILELLNRGHERFLDCSHLTLEEAEQIGGVLATLMRDAGFWFGDLARYSEARWPDTHHQVWPTFTSPGQLARNGAVCRAYPKREDRQHKATYSQYMSVSGKPDRQALLAEMIDKGQTTDESRKADSGRSGDGKRWLLAVDCNYFLHRFWHSGAGVEAASGVSTWIGRTVERLKQKGLTDVACCFDDRENHRKDLTKDWEDKYKGNRGPKDPELANQIQLLRSLVENLGLACVSSEGMEADDCIASLVKQFDGKSTILSQDKDLKQLLSSTCNILLDVTWTEDSTSGDILPEYHWYTAADLLDSTGLRPDQFPDLQCLMGDSSDCIKGAPGIGEKGALNLMQEFGSVDACIQAAHDSDERLLAMSRGKIMAKGLLELEPVLATVRQLVTLVDNIGVPQTTRV